MPSNFFSIPSELQIQILCNLDAVSLVRCARTCKYLYDAFKNSTLLMYVIQLYFDGLKNTGTSTPAADSVALLRRRRQAWLSLEWTERVAFEIQHRKSVYDLVGSMFAHADKDNLEIISLPISGNDNQRSLRRALNGMVVHGLTMDPTQDLMVLLEDVEDVSSLLSAPDTLVACVHIRTISTDVPHPLAVQNLLEFSVFSSSVHEYIMQSPTLEIAHNILALSFETVDYGNRMLIWDWTTSDLLLDSSKSFDASLPFRFRGCSIGLLDSIYFLVASPTSSGSIRLYKLNRAPSVDDLPALHLATLRLPPLIPGSWTGSISIQTEPIQAHPLTYAPFTTNDEDRLYVFRIEYNHESGDEDDDDAEKDINLFVHQRLFTKYISQQARFGDPPLDIPWAEWGPLNTRMTCPAYGTMESYSKRYVHGQRVVFPRRLASQPTSVKVLDFSRAAVLSAKGYFPMPPASSLKNCHWVLTPSSRIEVSWDCPFFGEEIRTHLPCVYIMRDLDQTYSGYTVHADGFLGIKVNDDGSLTSHVYTI